MRHLLMLAILLHVSLSTSARGAWQTGGNPISVAPKKQGGVQILPNATGGALFVWIDGRNTGNSWDLYADAVDASGGVLSTTNGVGLCIATLNQDDPQIISDGFGGAIVVWSDDRFGSRDVYAQRTNSVGISQWTANGVPVCVRPGPQVGISIVSDGGGGVLVAWSDLRNPPFLNDIYAQRLDATGSPQWPSGGVGICTVPENALRPSVAADGAGGAVIAWEDGRGGIFAQRIDASGTTLWQQNGVALCTAPGDQDRSTAVPDGTGGAVVVWEDRRNGADIYAQRVDQAGAVQWAIDGVPVCAEIGGQIQLSAISDHSGGVIATWGDYRNELVSVRAQRVYSSGLTAWNSDGVILTTTDSLTSAPVIAPDGSGGAIVAWSESSDIYAQHVTDSGVTAWAPNGTAICIQESTQLQPSIAADAAGGAFIAWEDGRNEDPNFSDDIYALHVDANGDIVTAIRDTPSASLLTLTANPNPFAHETTLVVGASVDSEIRIEVFDVKGSVVRTLDLTMSATERRIHFIGRDGAGKLLPSGVYFVRARSAGESVTRKIVIAR
jgi:hypothetical protein